MMIFQIFRMGTITTILYVLIGIGVFSLTLLLLERKTMKYIGKIAMAIQNISEGDLNTQIEVVGDDEFSAMASNLNRMEADIRKLMDKERESERTKNELITNVAHDLRTPLTSIIGYLELLSSGPAISQEMQKKYIDIAAKCLSALGAKIEEMETGFLVSPIKKVPEGRCDLYCGESGSTLRFLLPIVGALGAQAVFHREGRLPQRLEISIF